MSPLYWLGHILMSLLQSDSDSEGQMALVLAQAAINKIPGTTWLNNKSLFSHQSGGWKVQDQGSSRIQL